MFKRVCIIGVGLIGGSLALALKKHKLAQHVVGCGRQQDNLERALKQGVIDSYELDLATAVKDAELIVLAVPVAALASVMTSIKASMTAHCILMDVGSTKQSVINDYHAVFGQQGGPLFVPAHPIAGKESSGVDGATADLFTDKWVVLTPPVDHHSDVVARVDDMWQQMGAKVIAMDAAQHDRIFATCSHLPHLLAYALMFQIDDHPLSHELLKFSGSGFKDFTRIAGSDPQLWKDVCEKNKDEILDAIHHFQSHLKAIEHAIENNDQQLLEIFSRAKAVRDKIQ